VHITDMRANRYLASFSDNRTARVQEVELLLNICTLKGLSWHAGCWKMH
jgi:hypothetical protein